MFCHMCGQKLAENARFCSKCGTAVAQTATKITEEYRQKVYNELAELMLGALDNGSITVEGSKEIAAFVLVRLEDIDTQAALDKFLDEMVQKWPFYQTIVHKLRKDETP